MWAMALSKSPVLEEFVEEIREAGEKFGKLFSRDAAQAFAASSSATVARTSDSSSSGLWSAPGDAQRPPSARSDAPADLREALVGPQERF